jgi:formylmethanofuran dehydrogenase subunit E
MADDPDEPSEPLVECAQCHTRVPERQLVRLYGKQLCYGCTAAWFGDDDDDDEADDD